MLDIIYPNPPVYYIAYTGDIYSCGFVDTNQCMESGLGILETFTDKPSYSARLAVLGFADMLIQD